MPRSWLASDTAFLIIGNIIGSGFGYLFLVAMGRALQPSDFGVFGALFAIFSIVGLASQSLREAIAAVVSRSIALEGQKGAIAGFLRIARRLGIVAPIPALVFIAAAGPIASFFQMASIAPVILLGLALLTAIGLDIILGLQQGLQQFRRLGSTGFYTSQGLKLVFGVLFVWWGWKLDGAVGSLLASTAVALVMGLWLSRRELAKGTDHPSQFVSGMGAILMPVLLLGVFIAVPTSVDVMLITHFFGGNDAGWYNAAATIGKVVIYLPMAVSFVLLPKVSEKYNLGADTRGMLARSLVTAFALSGLVVLVCWAFPVPVIRIFFGEAYTEAAGLITQYGVAMLLCSLNIVLIHYSLAVRKNWLMYAADAVTLLEIAAIYLWHQSLSEVVWILLLGNLAVFLLCFPALTARAVRRQ